VLFVNPTWFVPAVAPMEMPTGLPLMRLASVLMSSNASMGGLRQRPWAHRPRRTLTCGGVYRAELRDTTSAPVGWLRVRVSRFESHGGSTTATYPQHSARR
jgi:hypothetical protein